MCPLMHELRAETYFGMIRLLKPGCRSLVLLVDEENKERLLRQFAQYIFPIRKLVSLLKNNIRRRREMAVSATKPSHSATWLWTRIWPGSGNFSSTHFLQGRRHRSEKMGMKDRPLKSRAALLRRRSMHDWRWILLIIHSLILWAWTFDHLMKMKNDKHSCTADDTCAYCCAVLSFSLHFSTLDWKCAGECTYLTHAC